MRIVRSLAFGALLWLASGAAACCDTIVVRTESLVGYIVKPGRAAQYGGLRLAADWAPDPRLIVAGRLEAARQQDGGGADVNLADPSTFGSLEGTFALAGRIHRTVPLYMVGAFGLTVPYDKGKAAVLERYPRTALLGVWLRVRADAWVMLGGGLYEPNGSGPAGWVSAQVPLRERTSLILDAATAKNTTLRANLGVCMFGCK